MAKKDNTKGVEVGLKLDINGVNRNIDTVLGR